MYSQIRKKYLLYIAVFVLCFCLFPFKVRAASLSNKNITMSVGATKTLKLKGAKASKTKWKSSNISIVTVNKKGKVKGKKAGNAKIYASYKGKKYTCNVKVVSLKLNKKTSSVNVGKTIQLKIKGKPNNTKVSWNSSNKGIASVSKSGIVKGVSAGTAIISGKCCGKILKCTITVKNAISGSNKSEEKKEVEYEKKSKTEEEKRVYNILMSFRGKYPEGMRFTNKIFYSFNGGVYGGGYGCAAFAFELSDAAFGYANASVVRTNITGNIRTGDIIIFGKNKSTHVVIVLDVEKDSVVVAEANYDAKVKWGRRISFKEINEDATSLLTRYSDNQEQEDEVWY